MWCRNILPFQFQPKTQCSSQYKVFLLAKPNPVLNIRLITSLIKHQWGWEIITSLNVYTHEKSDLMILFFGILRTPTSQVLGTFNGHEVFTCKCIKKIDFKWCVVRERGLGVGWCPWKRCRTWCEVTWDDAVQSLLHPIAPLVVPIPIVLVPLPHRHASHLVINLQRRISVFSQCFSVTSVLQVDCIMRNYVTLKDSISFLLWHILFWKLTFLRTQLKRWQQWNCHDKSWFVVAELCNIKQPQPQMKSQVPFLKEVMHENLRVNPHWHHEYNIIVSLF